MEKFLVIGPGSEVNEQLTGIANDKAQKEFEKLKVHEEVYRQFLLNAQAVGVQLEDLIREEAERMRAKVQH